MLGFFFQAEDGIRDVAVTGVQTCALPIYAEWIREKAVCARRVRRVREHGQTDFATRGRINWALQVLHADETRAGKERRRIQVRTRRKVEVVGLKTSMIRHAHGQREERGGEVIRRVCGYVGVHGKPRV